MTPKQLLMLNDLKKRGLISNDISAASSDMDVEATLVGAINALEAERDQLRRDLTFYQVILGNRLGDGAEQKMEEALGYSYSPLCDGCRFGKIDRDPLDSSYFSTYNTYQCSLLGSEVYSKYPQCTVGDWMKKMGITEPVKRSEVIGNLIYGDEN